MWTVANMFTNHLMWVGLFLLLTRDSLVDQYPSTLVHIVGFKFLKNQANILQVLGGMRSLGWGVREVYKD